VCLAAIAESFLELGRRDEAERAYRESRDIRRSLGDAVGEIVAIIGLARVRRFAGDLEDARRLARSGLEAARQRGRLDFQVSAFVELACVAYEEQRYEEVEEHANAVRSLVPVDRRRGEGAMSRFLRGLSWLERGDRRALEETELAAAEIPLQAGSSGGVLLASLRARTLASFGRTAEAVEALGAIAEKMSAIDGLPGLESRFQAARAALVLGDRALAARFAEEASRALPGCADAGLRGRVEALLRDCGSDR
jgi:tetratricopeptide (TPR) repeat protein